MAGMWNSVCSWGLLLGCSLLPFAQGVYGEDPDSQAKLGRAPLDVQTKDSRQPNIVFILTDDQDLHLNSLDYMPLTHKHVTEQGTQFKRHFCTTAICCPSRVTLWTGKAAHNTNVTDVSPPYGGYPKFVNQGFNDNYLPVFLQDAGYSTYYTGKLFNAHTVTNYDSPYPAGWTGSDFLLDPFTYSYLNATSRRNQDPPVSYEGQYTTDVLAEKALGFLDDGVQGGKPFFLGIAPIAPHSNVGQNQDEDTGTSFTEPIPAERHAHLFPDAIVPRTANFNPDTASGASWVAQQSKQSPENVAYNDHFYRTRIRSLQAVDELVESVVSKLDEYGILDDTYVIYSSDNGFHIGNHRLQPGKECGYEEDVNVPLIIRGPGVPKGQISEIVTTHTDLAPTILQLAQGRSRVDFDGLSIPLTADGLEDAIATRHEHVTVEFWGVALSEGQFGYFDRNESRVLNNTYKAIRIISEEYNLYYSVWCNNEHELYDLNTDPGQLHNLLSPSSTATTLLDLPIQKIVARLDSLLLVTKTCKGSVCTEPWNALHPQGNVQSLRDALSPRFDTFYEKQQVKVTYSHCELGYIEEAEGAQFDKDGYVYRQGTSWSDWT